MLKAAAGGIGGLLLTATLLAASAAAVVSQLLGGVSPGASGPSPLALSGIPPDYLLLYQHAARTCPGLDWTVLAGIGEVETDHGQADLPGVRSGANSAGAEGPMQFLPATFAEYSLPVPPGGQDPPSPYDPVDAIYATARMLCADGAANGRDLHGAIFAYNHSENYVAAVLAAARAYAADITPSGPVGGVWTPAIGQAIADRALRWLGWPYTFDGGNAAGPTYGNAVDYDSRNDAHVYGFDCSGLSLYAVTPWLNLDHDAATQYSQAGSVHPAPAELQPGDLVFWSNNGTVTGIGHEAIYLGQGQVVQAPHSGAQIEITPLALVESGYFGATRPLT